MNNEIDLLPDETLEDIGDLEERMISMIGISDEDLPEIPNKDGFISSYITRLKNTPTTLSKCYIDSHPFKGRIMRASQDIECGEGILMEFPLVKISEYGRADKIAKPEILLKSYDNRTSEIKNYLAGNTKQPDKVLTYNPYDKQNPFVDLITNRYESDIAKDYNVQSDFVTLARNYKTMEQDVKNDLKELFSIDPRRYVCKECKMNFNEYNNIQTNTLPGFVKQGLCKLCLLLHNMLQQEVFPLIRFLPCVGIKVADNNTENNVASHGYFVPLTNQQYYKTNQEVDDIVRACLSFDFNCFETGTQSISVFRKMCVFSHSCAPSAVWEYSHLTRMMKLTACRNISKGDEITISYLCDDDLCCPRAFRRMGLECSHMFQCSCVRCLAENPELSERIIKYITNGCQEEGEECREEHEGKCKKELGTKNKATKIPHIVTGLYSDGVDIKMLSSDLEKDEVTRKLVEKKRLEKEKELDAQFELFKNELGKSCDERNMILEVSKGSKELVGYPWICEHCGHSFSDAFVPCIKCDRAKQHSGGVSLTTSSSGSPCPKCFKTMQNDVYHVARKTKQGEAERIEYVKLHRNDLYNIWVSILEDSRLLENPSLLNERHSVVIDRLVELVGYCIRSRCGFLASEYTALLGMALYNYSQCDSKRFDELKRSGLLLASVIKCYRNNLFGYWIDSWLSNYYYNEMRDIAKRLGMGKLYGMLGRLIWACDVRCGIESDSEYNKCAMKLETIMEKRLEEIKKEKENEADNDWEGGSKGIDDGDEEAEEDSYTYTLLTEETYEEVSTNEGDGGEVAESKSNDIPPTAVNFNSTADETNKLKECVDGGSKKLTSYEMARRCEFEKETFSPPLPFSERISPVSNVSALIKPCHWLGSNTCVWLNESNIE